FLFVCALLPGLILHRFASNLAGVIGSLLDGWILLQLAWRHVPDSDPQTDDRPLGDALRRNIAARHIRGYIARMLFMAAIVVALIVLATLVWTIVNKTVGLTVLAYDMEPEALAISTYDPGAPLGEVTAAELPAILAENVHPVRLQELILERVVDAKPKQWDALKTESLVTLLDGYEFPAELADATVTDLTPLQTAAILTNNLDVDALQTLIYTEAGRPLVLFSDAELIAVLAEALSVEQLQILVREYVVEVEDSAYTGPVDTLTAPEAAAVLVDHLDRAAVDYLLILHADFRTLDDASAQELGALLAVNVRKARLRVFAYDDIIQGRREAYPEQSTQPISVLLTGQDYPAQLADTPFNKLDEVQLANLIAHMLGRDTLIQILTDEILVPHVAESWTLWDSWTTRSNIESYQQREYPLGQLEWHSWVNRDFLSNSINYSQPDATGVRPALYGTLLIILITIFVAFPVGVGAAIYLEEYAGSNLLNRIIQTNINNLAGVPSIIYGMLGLAIFVRAMEHYTSGNVVGTDGQNGRTVLSAGFTLALLILPVIIINAQEAIRAVPGSLRQASYGLGATRWQTIWNHVLPYAMPGVLTGTILAISRAIGETAPLILVGGATYLSQDPDGPFSQFTALPLVIYRLTTLPQDEFRNAAAAAIIVLLALLLTLNSIAVILRNRFTRRLS
ncbi:MAG: phosphate ABC transporter permease PstA, partial [Anaerolineae bacterium]|nr:phosphate ABC transporter permease PstA [Anaerolineae bacterium]